MPRLTTPRFVRESVRTLARRFLPGVWKRHWIAGELQFRLWLVAAKVRILFARAQGKRIILDADYYRLSIEDFHVNLKSNRLVARFIHFVQIPRSLIEKSFDHALAVRAVLDTSLDDLLVLQWDGLPLGDVFRTKFAGDAWRLDYRNNPDRFSVDVVRREYLFGIAAYEAHRRAISRLKPDSIFVYQGSYATSRLLREAGIRANVPVVAVENAFLGDRVYLDHTDGMIQNRFSLAKYGREYRELKSETAGANEQVLALWEQALASKISDHRSGGIDTADSFHTQFAFSLDRPFVLVLGQVQVDAAIMMDSYLWPNSVDFYEAVVRHCSQVNLPVVVRFHPREALEVPGMPLDASYHQLLDRFARQAPSDVCLVPGREVDTYLLISHATLVVTLNSQAGLEAAIRGKTVVTAAECLYARKGFTWDVGNQEVLTATLDAAWRKACAAPDDTEVRRKASQFILDMASNCMPRRSVKGDEKLILRQFGVSGIPPQTKA